MTKAAMQRIDMGLITILVLVFGIGGAAPLTLSTKGGDPVRLSECYPHGVEQWLALGILLVGTVIILGVLWTFFSRSKPSRFRHIRYMALLNTAGPGVFMGAALGGLVCCSAVASMIYNTYGWWSDSVYRASVSDWLNVATLQWVAVPSIVLGVYVWIAERITSGRLRLHIEGSTPAVLIQPRSGGHVWEIHLRSGVKPAEKNELMVFVSGLAKTLKYALDHELLPEKIVMDSHLLAKRSERKKKLGSDTFCKKFPRELKKAGVVPGALNFVIETEPTRVISKVGRLLLANKVKAKTSKRLTVWLGKAPARN